MWTTDCVNGTCEQVLANGQIRLSVTPAGDHGFSILRSVRRWPLQLGRTLEYRVNLIHSSGDGAIARCAFGLGPDGGGGLYVLAVDQDSIVLSKRDSPVVQCFVLANGSPVRVDNVKLVLAMTGTPYGVRLEYRILDNARSGAVIHQGECWDTPARDPIQKASDDPPGNYLGLSGLFHFSVYHDNAGIYDPSVGIGHLEKAEVVFDNAEVLEYDVQRRFQRAQGALRNQESMGAVLREFR